MASGEDQDDTRQDEGVTRSRDDQDPQNTGTDQDARDDAGRGSGDRDQDLADRVTTLEADLEERTVAREDLETDLRRYVRRRQRRGHARGWGPYLVLLYGTAMTLGAFFLLSGGWAILAMIVVWLSTLGLYVLFVLTGVGLSILEGLARIPERIRGRS